ncbi:MAG: DUF4440 domain-containing protein [Ignavibacteria bacterium]
MVGSEDVGNETVDSLRASLRTPSGADLIDCPNCKTKIDSESVYCKNCGFNVIENKFDDDKSDKGGADDKEEFEKEFKKRYKKKISITRKRFILTAFSFVVLFSVVGYLLYFSVNKLNVYFSSDEYKIRNTIDNWKDAWQEKNINKYKKYLTDDYTYYGSDGRKVDLTEKLERMEYTFKNYEYIKIGISDFEFVKDSVFTENDRKVQFSEKYESDKFNEEGLKILRLYKGEETNGEWKIYREIFKEK